MTKFDVVLASVDEVKQFVDAASRCPCEVDVHSKRYVVDGKSIMGLFSLDLSQPVTVEVVGTPEQGAAFRTEIAKFIR